jgi:hypothetical protein
MSLPAPIALFVYKRLQNTRQTVESLKKNSLAAESELFIFSDNAKTSEDQKSVNEIRRYIREITGFKKINIIERDRNLGLANSIIDGVTTVIDRYGKIIVLEDDMLLSNYFLHYMNEALNLYQGENDVISIHAYIYPVKTKLPETFFLKGADCWGWATWKRGWDLFEPNSEKLYKEIRNQNLEFEFDYNGVTNNVRMLKRQINTKVDSWAIRWHASAFLKNKLTLYPGRSLLNNIGTNGGGTHTKSTRFYETSLTDKPIKIEKIPIRECKEAQKAIEKFFISIKPNFIKRYFKIIKHKLNF